MDHRDQRLDNIVRAHRQRTGEQSVLVCGLLLAEETGEAIQQLRRFAGHARSTVTIDDVVAELADVVISASILARLLDVDLDGAVSRKLDLGVR